MITIQIENHCHCLMSDGSVASAKVSPLGAMENSFTHVDPMNDLEMTHGEFDLIRKQLQQLNGWFPHDRPKLPKSEEKEFVFEGVHPI